MGLSWQQGPLGRNPNGRLLVAGMPERVLYAEPLRRTPSASKKISTRCCAAADAASKTRSSVAESAFMSRNFSKKRALYASC